MIRAALLNRRATIERLSIPSLQDSLGEQVKLWETYRENVPLMIQALNANERAMLGSTGVDVSHRGYMNPLNEALTERDRLLVDGEIYYIGFVDNVAGLNHHWELALSQTIDGGN